MSIISTTIPNMVNGISQQPFALRLASQAEEQVNGYSSVVDGLRKRPGTKHIKRLPSTVSSNTYLHTINRDAVEQYLVVISNGDLRVFDLAGNEKTVNFPNGKTYLSSSSPRDTFRCVTVADYTFVLNTNTTVQQDTTLSPNTRPNEALVWIKQGAYGATYKITVNTSTASYTVPDGSQAAHVTNVTTDYIAGQLRSQLATALGADFVVSQYNSLIYVRRADHGTFTVKSQDSIGETGIEVFFKTVQRFSSLPARAVNGFKVEVSGDQSSSFDNYYVEYKSNDGSFDGPGVWKESLKGGEEIRIKSSTMPHALIRQSDGTFTFQTVTWTDRKIGSLDIDPMPSFVGRKITDIFFHRNRLGFISDENVVMSRTGDYFNFFRGTATAVLDDDPIDIGVSHVKVSLLRHAVPFSETLLLFSDQTQFQLAKTDLLTPETVSIDQTTEYECSLKAKPVGVGRHVYFTVNRGRYSGVKEYYLDATTEVLDADDVTGHVPRFLPGDVFKIASSGTEDCLCFLTDQAKNKVFVYKFYWAENEKMQASWSHWEFPSDVEVLNADFIESKLYLVMKRPDGIHIESVDLEPGRTENDWDIAVHLDQKLDQSKVVSITFNQGDPAIEADDTTSVVLPYKLATTDPAQIMVVTAPGGSRSPGVVFSDFTLTNSSTNTTVVLKGNWTGQPFYIGTPYTFRYKFSTLAVREEASGGGQNVIGEGRLQLRRMSILYDKTGYFRVEVTPYNRDTYSYVFSGRVVGSGQNIIGRVPVERGKFRFPLMSKNDQIEIEIVNDSFLPCHFLSAEWEGFFILRSKRL
jgi:hypothetical protein